ncbi:hypothetical protein C0Q70_19262 [Pomacea canaliculata]|uniref:NAD-dependent protein deacylase n=1 Tax=Pomacea canaliculata TaxID=400727 RepID=A0A2T7NIW9_POMCA|nr:hypothetical protein C0Q70_19262 [Pomacea canaliculata]
MAAFREQFAKAKHIVVLTGAGVSAESGVPTFRGAGGFWRKYQAQDLATPEAFKRNPSLVWEFYHYRREVMLSKTPNPAHIAIAECEKRLAAQGRRIVVITQNIDELHERAGSKNILELHGNLFTTRCTKCKDVKVNKDSPICPALSGKGLPDADAPDARIPESELPRCMQQGCNGLLRPMLFGLENLWILRSWQKLIMNWKTVGTSSVVYPAAMFAPQVAARGVPVAEFNMEHTPVTHSLGFHFQGPAGVNVPIALAAHESEKLK